jgi:hypothetical protein
VNRPRADRARGSGGKPAAVAHPRTDGASALPTGRVRRPVGHARGEYIFTRLKWVSFTHSCVYTALLVCAFAIGKPQPETFVLGLTHGLLWIAMSLTCIVCVRLRIVPLRLATAVAVLGGIGPFFGSYEFVREQRRRQSATGLSRGRPVKSCEGQVKQPSHDSLHPPAALE